VLLISWFETRSEICWADREANLHLEKLIINLGLRAKKIPDCVRYIGTVGKVRGLKVVVVFNLVKAFVARRNSACS
jgi:hypothetical protein